MSDINVARTNMARDISNGIVSEPKFVAGITYKLKNGLHRIFSKFITQKCIYGHGIAAWRLWMLKGSAVVVVSFRVGHHTPDIGLLAPGTGFRALHPLRYAAQSLAFTHRRRALAFVARRSRSSASCSRSSAIRSRSSATRSLCTASHSRLLTSASRLTRASSRSSSTRAPRSSSSAMLTWPSATTITLNAATRRTYCAKSYGSSLLGVFRR